MALLGGSEYSLGLDVTTVRPQSRLEGAIHSLNCKKLVPGVGTKGGSAAQAIVGSIVWAFRRLKKPRNWQMSAPQQRAS